MYSRMSWEATSALMPIGAQHGRGRLIRPKRASSANRIRKRRPRLAAARLAFLTACGKPLFFKSVLSRDVASGVKRTRHHLAPAVPGQKIIDRALAGFVPDGLFVGCLEIVNVQHFAGSSGLGKTRQQHVLALASAAWSRLECLDATVSCAPGSPCSATRPLPRQSKAASSRSRAATPSGCADAARAVFSIAALFSTAGPGLWCI